MYFTRTRFCMNTLFSRSVDTEICLFRKGLKSADTKLGGYYDYSQPINRVHFATSLFSNISLMLCYNNCCYFRMYSLKYWNVALCHPFYGTKVLANKQPNQL